jgi:hypothetical protein
MIKKSALLASLLLATSCTPNGHGFKLNNGGTLYVKKENVNCDRNQYKVDPEYAYCFASGVVEMLSGDKVDWSSDQVGCWTKPDGPVIADARKNLNEIVCEIASYYQVP